MKKRFLIQHESCECKCRLNINKYECEYNKTYKNNESLDIKNCCCEKFLIGKSVLECEDEKLYTTENLLNDKKVAYAKSKYLIHTISLVILYSYYFISDYMIVVSTCHLC